MKRTLSLLMAFVFLQTQSWALSGGPRFGGSGQTIVGTYAGILIPDTSVPGGLVALDANALGIFSVGVPQNGVAAGPVAFFNKGEVFTGKIAAVVDPDSGELTGLMEASAIRIITVEVSAGSAVGAFGSDVRTVGKLEAEIVEGKGLNPAQRLRGSAVLSSFSDTNRNPDGTPIISGTISFIVDGFKQSSDDTAAGTIDFNINASS
jgi:hypothetical protein